jgi:hypothetical protein
MLALICAVVCIGAEPALARTVQEKNRPQTGNGVEAVGTKAWPAVPAQLAENIARDSFGRNFARVWSYLAPAYRQAIPQSQWQACQQAHPAAPRNIKITRVAVAQATELPIDLSLLGRQNVQEIQVYVQYRSHALAEPQIAVLYTLWLKQGKIWRAVWPSDEFKAYESGSCYVTPGGSPLY